MKKTLPTFESSDRKINQNQRIIAVFAISLLSFVFGGHFSSAQVPPAEEWSKVYGGRGDDYLKDFIELEDGGYLLGGFSDSDTSELKTGLHKGSYDYWIIRTDKNGNRLWDKTYGGNSADLLYKIIPANDGGYLLIGNSASPIGFDKTAPLKSDNSGYDIWVVKITADGTKLWDKSYGGNRNDVVSDAEITSDGGVLLIGSSNSGINEDKSEDPRPGVDNNVVLDDIWLVKIDANGQRQWDKTYGGSRSDGAASITPLPEGGYIIGATSNSDIGYEKTDSRRCEDCTASLTTDYWILKISETGVKEWDKVFGGYVRDWMCDIAVLPDGYLLGGTSDSYASGDKTDGLHDWRPLNWIIKISKTGEKIWDRVAGNTQLDNLVVDETGYYYGGSGHYAARTNKMEWDGLYFWDRGSDHIFFYGFSNILKKGKDKKIIAGITGLHPGMSDNSINFALVKYGHEPTPPGRIKGEYFKGRNLNSLVLTRNDATINFNWGPGSPDPKLPADEFSVRWTAQIVPKFNEQYTFTITSNNGRRLWVDDKLVIDKWTTDQDIPYSGKITLKAGQLYDLRLEYFETTGDANIKLEWQSTSLAKEIVPAIRFYPPLRVRATGLYANYFNGQNFEKLALQRIDTTVGFHWGVDSPAPEVTKDNFSVRWLGQIQPGFSETYTFHVTSDNGRRLWINNNLIIDNWNEESYSKSTGSIALEAGQKYNIRLEYFEGNGGAACKLEWQSASQLLQIVPKNKLSPVIYGNGDGLNAVYYNGRNFEQEVLRKTEFFLNLNWSDRSPDPAINTDNFSARWTGLVQPNSSGTYTFYISSDNGRRLWVNNQLLIDKWIDNTGEYSGKINLIAGEKYPIKIEYFEGTGSAMMRLEWETPDGGRRDVSPSQLYTDNQSVTVAASIYQHCNYNGYKIDLGLGQYTLAVLLEKGIKNDDISSLKVSPGYRVTLYENNNFKGKMVSFTTDDPCLVDNNFNDLCTSIRIERFETTPFFRENFEETTTEKKSYAAPNPFTDETSIFVGETDEREAGLRIFNSKGIQVKNYKDKVSDGKLIIGRDIPPGLYIINIQIGKSNKLFKIIKE